MTLFYVRFRGLRHAAPNNVIPTSVANTFQRTFHDQKLAVLRTLVQAYNAHLIFSSPSWWNLSDDQLSVMIRNRSVLALRADYQELSSRLVQRYWHHLDHGLPLDDLHCYSRFHLLVGDLLEQTMGFVITDGPATTEVYQFSLDAHIPELEYVRVYF